MESSNEKDVRQQQDSDLESNADSSADSNAEIKKILRLKYINSIQFLWLTILKLTCKVV